MRGKAVEQVLGVGQVFSANMSVQSGKALLESEGSIMIIIITAK